MNDLQIRVNAWQSDTFGHLNTFHNIREKLAEEISELASAIWPDVGTFPDPARPVSHRAKIAEESADVVIVLMGLARNQGFDLLSEVEKKLEINKARQWDGCSHIQGDA